jgi:Tol biopolymer transport system component
MKPENWQEIERIFIFALEYPPAEQAAFLDKSCAGNDSVRKEVERLLERQAEAEGFIEVPAIAVVARRLAADSDSSKRSMIGKTFSHYRIVEEIGHGGMGEVFLAEDMNLNRQVAVKVLPDLFIRDPERLALFDREAKLLASLNHPNISALHEMEKTESSPLLVMEFIEGETLAERIAKGRSPIDEILDICRQIAEGLEAAHYKGVIHRDLKPANVKITPAGKVKILDFGLAGAFQARAAVDSAKSGVMTDTGLILGTPNYMSPEQAQGNIVDARSDIWAFGCILYEMLTGGAAFASKDAPITAEAILKREPDWSLLPWRTPAPLKRLVRRCLEKDFQRRPQSAKDLRQTIEEIQAKHRRRYSTWAAAILACIALGGFALFGLGYINKYTAGELRVTETQQVTSGKTLELDPSISPDGKWLAYAGGAMDHMDIYVQRISNGEAKNLTQDLGTADKRWPRWSPDGKLIALVTDNRPPSKNGQRYESGHTIQIIPYTGGQPQSIVQADLSGHTWSPDGKKLAYIRDNSLYINYLDSGVSHKIGTLYEPHSPSWSPNGKWIALVSGNSQALFEPSVLGNVAPSSIMLFDAATGKSHALTDRVTGNVSPVWMPDSRSILFLSTRGGGQDVFELRLSDAGEPQGDPVRVTAGLDALSMDASADGRSLACAKFMLKSNLAALPIPKSETVSSSTAIRITTGSEVIETAAASPDGKWLAFDSNRSGSQHIYKMPRMGGPMEELTFGRQDDFAADWSPDGKSIALHSFRKGNRDIYVMSADGTNLQQVTNNPAQERFPCWSPDGQSLVFHADKSGKQEIYRVSRKNGQWGMPVQLTSTESGAMFARWSPDGRTIAYCDLSKGLCLISPEGKNARVLVSRKANIWPFYVAWSKDGKTIYFRAGDERHLWNIWSVPANGGMPKMLVRFEHSSRNEFSTDDIDFFFTVTERESDIWMLRLKR